MTSQARTGRSNQKERTRRAIVDATRDLIRTGAEVTMPAVAKSALVSEATAYRYFPTSSRCCARRWLTCGQPGRGARAGRGLWDPVERVAYAAEVCSAMCWPTRVRYAP